MGDITAALDGIHGPVVYVVLAIWTLLLFWFPTGLILPGEPFFVLVGILAAGGQISFPAALAIIVVSSVASPVLGYFTGLRFDGWIQRRPVDSKLRRALVKGEDAIRKRGTTAAALSCWIPLLRITVPIMIGASRYPFARFFVLSSTGTAVWCSIFVVGGYFAGPFFEKFAVYVGITLIVVFVGAVLIKLGRKVIRRPAQATLESS